MDAAVNHGALDVHTHMSETVFLDPVPDSQKTVYVTARNTSDHPEVDLRGPLTQAIVARGYRIVDDPQRAHFMLRVNVLQAGKVSDQDRSRILGAQYGEPLLGGLAGAGIASALSGGNSAAAVGAGLGVALATYAINQAFQDVTYAVTTDIQISEKPRKGARVYQHTNTVASGANGTANSAVTSSDPYQTSYAGSSTYNSHTKTQNVDELSDHKQYQVRSVAYADKLNLKFEEAAPLLTNRLATTLSNVFE